MGGEITECLCSCYYAKKAQFGNRKCIGQEEFIASQILYRNVGPAEIHFIYSSSRFSITTMETIDLDVRKQWINPSSWVKDMGIG